MEFLAVRGGASGSTCSGVSAVISACVTAGERW